MFCINYVYTITWYIFHEFPPLYVVINDSECAHQLYICEYRAAFRRHAKLEMHILRRKGQSLGAWLDLIVSSTPLNHMWLDVSVVVLNADMWAVSAKWPTSNRIYSTQNLHIYTILTWPIYKMHWAHCIII